MCMLIAWAYMYTLLCYHYTSLVPSTQCQAYFEKKVATDEHLQGSQLIASVSLKVDTHLCLTYF